MSFETQKYYWINTKGRMCTTNVTSPDLATRVEAFVAAHTAVHTAPEGQAPLPNEGEPFTVLNPVVEIKDEDGHVIEIKGDGQTYVKLTRNLDVNWQPDEAAE